MKNKKGFTLIELLAVLVVLAILALIAVPIVVGIINNARNQANKRSVASYAKALEKYIAMDNIDNANNGYNLLATYITRDEMNKQYSGSNVSCEYDSTTNSNEDTSNLINGKLVLRWCKVNNSDIAYKYENGNVTEEKIYPAYEIGRDIIVHGDQYYVIQDSDKTKDYVVALKATPLTTTTINENAGGHVNRSNDGTPGTANEYDPSYGGVAFYRGVNCTPNGTGEIQTECKTSYNESEIKYVVDNWTEMFDNNELKNVNLNGYGSYKARLITYDELVGLGCTSDRCDNSPYEWTYSNVYWYWTMTPRPNWTHHMWTVDSSSSVRYNNVTNDRTALRPVINVYKSAIQN